MRLVRMDEWVDRSFDWQVHGEVHSLESHRNSTMPCSRVDSKGSGVDGLIESDCVLGVLVVVGVKDLSILNILPVLAIKGGDHFELGDPLGPPVASSLHDDAGPELRELAVYLNPLTLLTFLGLPAICDIVAVIKIGIVMGAAVVAGVDDVGSRDNCIDLVLLELIRIHVLDAVQVSFVKVAGCHE